MCSLWANTNLDDAMGDEESFPDFLQALELSNKTIVLRYIDAVQNGHSIDALETIFTDSSSIIRETRSDLTSSLAFCASDS